MTTVIIQPGAEAPELKPASTGDDKTPVKAEPKETETPATSADGEDQTVESEKPEPKKRADGGFQRKINKLTARIDAKDHEIAELRTQLNGKGSAGALGADGDAEPARPRESDFSDWGKYEEAKEKYVADLAAYKVRKELRSAQARHGEETEARKADETRRDAMRRLEKRAAELAPSYQGMEDAVDRFFTDRDLPVSRAMAEYIMHETDRDVELIHALDADPDEAERISRLSPLATARALAKLEEKLPKPEARKVSNAPAPPKLVKGNAESPVKKLEDMTTAEYMAKRRADEAKAGTLRRMVQPRN